MWRDFRRPPREHASGENTARLQLEACLKSLHDSDMLIVWRLHQLGRSLGDLIHLTLEFKARGVRFASLTEQIDTRPPQGSSCFTSLVTPLSSSSVSKRWPA
jgi:DNA invertase Pin-like site-specific DNA recombinase